MYTVFVAASKILHNQFERTDQQWRQVLGRIQRKTNWVERNNTYFAQEFDFRAGHVDANYECFYLPYDHTVSLVNYYTNNPPFQIWFFTANVHNFLFRLRRVSVLSGGGCVRLSVGDLLC